jgi:hypothetical protein
MSLSTIRITTKNVLDDKLRVVLAAVNQANRTVDILKYLVAFSLFGIGVFCIFHGSELRISEFASTQLLHQDHSFERYSLSYSAKYLNSNQCLDSNFDVNLVFGLLDGNNVKRFNPTKRHISKQYSLTLSESAEQQFLYDLCHDIIKKFGDPKVTLSMQNVACFPLFFTQWMQVPCAETVDDSTIDTSNFLTPARSTCCGYELGTIVFPKGEYEHCTREWAKSYGALNTGLWFDGNATINAVTVKFQSNIPFDGTYSAGEDYWETVNSWTNNYLALTFPNSSLARGFFSSDLELLRFQRAVDSGISYSVTLALFIGALVVLFMTRNIISALMNILSASFAMYSVGSISRTIGYQIDVLVVVVFIVASGISIFSSSLMSQTLFENSMPNMTKEHVATEALNEILSAHVTTSLTMMLVGLCLLGSNTYFVFQLSILTVISFRITLLNIVSAHSLF